MLPLLGWALKDVQWSAVRTAVGRLGSWQIIVLVAINVVTLLSFSGRWWLILRRQGCRIPFLTLAGYRTASFGVSYFTPGPQFGGEPLQIYLLTRNHSISTPTATAATAVDKVLEVGINFLFLTVGGVVMSYGFLGAARGESEIGIWNVGIGLAIVGILTVVLAAFLVAEWFGWRPLGRLAARLPGRIALTVADSEKLVAHFFREQPRTVLAAMGVSVLSWGLILFEYWLSMAFLGLNLTPMQLLTAVTINRLAFLAPLPGGLGALESSQVLAMTALGLDPAIGISQSLIIRARDVATGLTGLGIGWRAAR